jgi:hypothetical protein
MYLKWLVDSNGERVSEQEAILAFVPDCSPERVALAKRWTFVPTVFFITFHDAIEFLIAQEEIRKAI